MDNKNHGHIDWPVLIISGGALLIFILLAFIDLTMVSELVSQGLVLSSNYFGAFWQLLMLATFFVGLWLAFSKKGKIKMGGLDKPEIGLWK